MTSEEIKGKDVLELSANGWLRELCIQLALLNEKQAIAEPTPGIQEAQRTSRRRVNDAS
jgi:hypothetical protein